jgi:hypothetical protein
VRTSAQRLGLQRQQLEHWQQLKTRSTGNQLNQLAISYGMQSANGAICFSRLLTVTTTLR